MNRACSTRIFGAYNLFTTILCWLVFLSPIVNLSAQTNLSWNKTLGGDGFEELQTMVETDDGHFVFFGSHTSNISGEITQASLGLSDYWLAKVDQTNGNIIWQNTYGGNLLDNGRSMVATSDGGFLLGGHSSTGINGTKTTVSFGACWNCLDYWVVKTDGDGNQLWDQTIQGNSKEDRMTTLIETTDGGFVLAGYSESDLGNDKSEANIGGADYWVVKLDADGNQLWDRTLGGTREDQPFAIIELPDGSILVGGLSFSSDDGNRTAPSRGSSDYWVVNLDANGATLWDQAYGGLEEDHLRDMIMTNDGGIVLIGESYSGANGERTQPSYGERDIWMLKIDLMGNVLWDRSIGASDRDQPFKITQSPNGNFLIASISKSPMGFDRSEPLLGGSDYWFVTTDANGNKIKDAVFGGDQNDNLYYALPMRNGDIILGGFTATNTSPQKTEPSRGNNDVWLLKYESTLDFDLGNDTIFCVDGTLNLDATINPCDCCIYTWEDGSNATNRNFIVDQDTTIILSVHDGFNSLKIDTINVSATDPLVIDLGADTYLCAGDSILLDAENPGQNHLWSPGNEVSQELIVTAGDTYQVTVTDQFGCTYVDQVVITDIAVTPTFNNEVICDGDSLFLVGFWRKTSGIYVDTLDNYAGCDSIIMTNLFVANVDTTRLFVTTCDENQAGLFSMTMDNQYGCDSTVILTTTFSLADTTYLNTVSCDPDALGVDTMMLSNQSGCDSIVYTMIASEDLEVDYELTDASCFDISDGSLLVNTVMGGMSPHLFAIDDGSFQSFALFTNLSAGPHTLWVQDADGCTSPYEFEIQAPPPLVVSLPNDTTITLGSALTLPVITSQLVDTIFWNEASGINCDSISCVRPEVQPFLNNIYIVNIANGDGCIASDTIFVNVRKERPFYIPTAFSPNQDGINDNFVLSPGPNVEMIHSVRIYNRWGALLYESPEALPLASVVTWDGQFNGKFVTNGVYIYLVEVSFVDGERQMLSGDITVVR